MLRRERASHKKRQESWRYQAIKRARKRDRERETDKGRLRE
jgi:hypothetical protein